MRYPLLSIITINFNDRDGLQRTLQSVLHQSFTDYEHIIIDAGSTDGSKETICDYSKRTNRLTYWTSEPDKGVYDGMNKGIHQAQGSYLLFLNAGDYLQPDILATACNHLTGEALVYGNLNLLIDGEQRLLTFPDPPLSATQVIASDFYLPHPATFIQRELLAGEGYSIHYKVISDWEFWIKSILLNNCTLKHIPITLSNFVHGGLSTNPDNALLIRKEKEEALNALFAPKVLKAIQLLEQIEKSPLYKVMLTTLPARHFQKKASKLVLFYYKIRCFLHRKRP